MDIFKSMIVTLFFIALVPIVSATDISITPNPIVFNINTSASQQLNVTISSQFSGVLFFNSRTPFIQSSISPNLITFSNGTTTYYLTLAVSVGNDFPAGNYTGELAYLFDNNEGKVNISIMISEKTASNISFPEKIVVTDGEVGEIVMNITNAGNTDITYILVSNSTYLTPTIDSVTVYRQGFERVLWYYKIPDKLAPADYAEIFHMNNETKTLVFSVKDKTLPSIVPATVVGIKVNDEFEIHADVYDNIDLKRVYMDLICAGIPARSYDFVKYYTSNYTVAVEKIDKPTTCVANIYAIDTSDNQNLTRLYFSVDYTYGLSYDTNVVIQKFKVDYLKKVLVLSSNNTINVTMQLINFTYPNVTNSTLYFAIGADNGDTFKKFENFGEVLQFAGKTFYLTFKSQVAGEFSGEILMTVPEYAIKDNDIDIKFSGVVGFYNVADPYSGEMFGVRLECAPQDLGSFEESYNSCKLRLPIDVDPRDASLPTSLRQIGLTDENYELRLKQQIEPLERQIGSLWSWLVAVLIIFVVSLMIMYIHFKPTILYLGE